MESPEGALLVLLLPLLPALLTLRPKVKGEPDLEPEPPLLSASEFAKGELLETEVVVFVEGFV